jgi:hypothetical protein
MQSHFLLFWTFLFVVFPLRYTIRYTLTSPKCLRLAGQLNSSIYKIS